MIDPKNVKFIEASEAKCLEIKDSDEWKELYDAIKKLSEYTRLWIKDGTYTIESYDEVKDVLEQYPTHADNIQILSRVGRSWRVTFDLWTHMPTGSVKQEKEANLVVDFAKNYAQKVATDGYYYNPLGMVVVGYHVTDKSR